MSDVFIGAGKATGMAFRADAGTALPTTPGATLGAGWTEIGAISEDGITLTLPSGEVIKNWSLTPERKINTENGVVNAPFLYTTQKVLETLFGEDNVTHTAADSTHGNVDSVEFSPDVSAEPCAIVFLMKDGNKLAMVGCSNALVTDISDVSFVGTSPAIWEAKIAGSWTFAIDDGQVTS